MALDDTMIVISFYKSFLGTKSEDFVQREMRFSLTRLLNLYLANQ